MQCKLKTIITDLKICVTLTLHTRGFLRSSCHYDKCDQWENTYSGVIENKCIDVISVYFYKPGILSVLDCFGRKSLVYTLIHGITRESGFYNIVVMIIATVIVNLLIFVNLLNLVVTEGDYSFENVVQNIASNEQIETRDFYYMNQNSIIDFTTRYNKSDITLYYRKCDPYFTCQYQYKVDRNDLPSLIIFDDYLYVGEKSKI